MHTKVRASNTPLCLYVLRVFYAGKELTEPLNTSLGTNIFPRALLKNHDSSCSRDSKTDSSTKGSSNKKQKKKRKEKKRRNKCGKKRE